MKLIPPARQRSAVVNDRQHRLTYGEEPQLATTFDSMHAFRALRKSRKRNGCFCRGCCTVSVPASARVLLRSNYVGLPPIIQQRDIRKETRHSRALKHGRWRLIESLQHSELCSLEDNLQAARLVETRHGTARSDDCYMLQRCTAKHWHRVAERGKKVSGERVHLRRVNLAF